MPADYLLHMTPIEARVGAAQCEKYHDIIAHRRKLAAIYTDGLGGIEGIQLPPEFAGATHSHYVLRCARAGHIKKCLLQKGNQLGELVDYYIPDMVTYRDCKVVGSRQAHDLLDKVVNLPVHPGVSEANANRIIELIRASI